MDILLNTIAKACVLVTLTFLLAQTGMFARPRRAVGFRDRLIAILVFLAMVVAEEFVAQQHTPMNARIIAACSAGLLAGPAVGAIVGIGASVLAYALQLTPPAGLGVAMLVGGLVGGIVHQKRPQWACLWATGLLLGFAATLVRFAMATVLVTTFQLARPPLTLGTECLTALVNGTGVALLLQVVVQMRAREESARTAALAEAQALQARMNPHFLFNVLNTLTALTAIDPQAVQGALCRLARFLRGNMEQHDRITVPLREELEIVTAYLDLESLRMGERLRFEKSIDAGILEALVPPFLVQPLIENAVKHGIQPCDEGGLVRLAAWADGAWLQIEVSDTGVGPDWHRANENPTSEFDRAHALELLRRRLAKLHDGAFALDFRTASGTGTTAAVRIPLVTGMPAERKVA